ncbi:MAG TPA: TolC family protein [Chitinophagaceae bacterium]|nr:TolC family protein [Chitinophagaceae bacterium]
MKRLLFVLYSFSVSSLTIKAQTATSLSIDECYQLARQNFPLIKQKDLIQKTKEYSIENISKGYLPQFLINGQATYQSEVTEIPVKLPNTTIPTLDKDQYKIYAEVNQTVFDGGVKRLQKQSVEANAAVEQQKLQVELYKLNERINQLFFGILLVNEQLAQTDILKKDIQLGITKINAAIANGTALKSSGDALQAELLKTDQRTIELKSVSQAYRDMLSLFINKPLDEHSALEWPSKITVSQTINRPEILLYDTEMKSFDIQNNLIKARNLPTAGLFLQGGYGRPALNMLKNDFDAYYVGGIRLNWSLSGLYTSKKEKALVNIKSKTVDLQKEVFLFNTNLTLKKQNAEISKLEQLIQSDNGIIQLRTRIKNTALSQLEYGVINSSDYLREVNAEDQAKQTQLLHEMQLLMAQYDQQITTGK